MQLASSQQPRVEAFRGRRTQAEMASRQAVKALLRLGARGERTVPESGPVVAHSSTLTTRGMSFRRSRVGVPSASDPLCTKRCSRPSAACGARTQAREPLRRDCCCLGQLCWVPSKCGASCSELACSAICQL